MVIHTKQELRKAILERILNQKEEESSFKSQVIGEKLLALSVFQRAKTILFYASIRGEVDTFAVMKQALLLGKRVALPVVRKEEKKVVPVAVSDLQRLTRGAYGIPEPVLNSSTTVPLSEIDLVVMPAVAFDRNNNRLGRGAGYYDRLLSELSPSTPIVGFAFDLQMVDAIPGLEAHDRPATLVLTN